MAYAFQNAPSKQLILDIPSVGKCSGFKFYDPFFLETPTPYPATLFLKWLSLFDVTSPFCLLLSLAPYLWNVGMSASPEQVHLHCVSNVPTDTFLLVDPFCAWPSLVCKVHPLVVEASTKLFSRSLRRTSFSDSTVSVSHQGYSTNSYSNFQFHNFFLAVINNFSLLYEFWNNFHIVHMYYKKLWVVSFTKRLRCKHEAKRSWIDDRERRGFSTRWLRKSETPIQIE